MVEHGRRIQQHFEDQHAYGGRSNRRNGCAFDDGRDQDFDGVEANACRDIEMDVGVMYPMQPPKRWHGMEHHVLKVDDEIQQYDRDNDRYGHGQWDVIEDTPGSLLARESDCDYDPGRGEAQNCHVDEHKAQVVRPPCAAQHRRGPARCDYFPQRDDGQDNAEEPESNQRLKLGPYHGREAPFSCWTRASVQRRINKSLEY
jgi:hypothetical protein